MTETLLKIEHLVKKFDDNLILDDINLEVKKGEVIVVIGPKRMREKHPSAMYQCPGADPGWHDQSGWGAY